MKALNHAANVVPNSSSRPFLSRIRIVNYKSIELCDLSPRPLTLLVGRNGAGKSNFLDALRFVSDSLQNGLDNAIKMRGGIDGVRRKSTGHPRNFTIELEAFIPEKSTGVYRDLTAQRFFENSSPYVKAQYAFEIAARESGGFLVKREKLAIYIDSERIAHYNMEDSKFISQYTSSMPPASPQRLYLVNAAGLPAIRPVYDALVAMGFYNLNPESMKELQSPVAGELLHRDGGNIASVIGRLRSEKPKLWQRIREYLKKIIPSIEDVERVALGPKETLLFRQKVAGSKHPWKFYATNMSDGTLRALATLVAVTQLADRTEPVPLVGIEEPETALHPAAAAALMGALREATAHTQVIVTSHSPDLLDQLREEEDLLLVVSTSPESLSTTIARPDPASLTSIKEHLYTPGELQRMGQLDQDPDDLTRQHNQLDLFSVDA